MNTLEKNLWSNGLSIGNTEIDTVHKQIIEIYYDLIDVVNFKLGREEFAKILSKMSDYGLSHFKREEEYMRKFSYPKFDEHKRYHFDYIIKISTWNSDFLTTEPPEKQAVIEYLALWWIHHIDKVDREYEEYKKNIHSIVVY